MAIPQLAKVVLYDCSTINATGDFFMDAMTKMAECGINACRAFQMVNTAETIVVLLEQRAELLEALKGMRDIWQSICDAHNWDAHHMYQFTKCVAAITKAEAAE